jgi:aspartyl-tRNA(Asn)/glutamyl-tRNA(Gln) amidotransferase subunit C
LRKDLALSYNIFMKIDVSHVAKLANLPLKPQEKVKFEKQLSEILTYIEKLKEINTENVEITSQVTGLENITREDKPTPSLTQDEALFNSKSQQNGLVKVKAILEG